MPIIVDGTPQPYATESEYTTWSGDTTATVTTSTLLRASELIDDHIVTAIYDADTTGYPLDATVATALRDATCAQVEFWLVGDEEDDILGPVQGVSLSGVQVQYGAGDNRATPMYLAPRAARLLRRAGLMSGAVRS